MLDDLTQALSDLVGLPFIFAIEFHDLAIGSDDGCGSERITVRFRIHCQERRESSLEREVSVD